MEIDCPNSPNFPNSPKILDTKKMANLDKFRMGRIIGKYMGGVFEQISRVAYILIFFGGMVDNHTLYCYAPPACGLGNKKPSRLGEGSGGVTVTWGLRCYTVLG